MSQHHAREWSARDSALWRERIGMQLPLPCVRCRRTVERGDAWQVDHIQSISQGGGKTSENLGPAHRRCNAQHGGKQGAAVTNAKRATARQTDQRLPNW